MLAHERIAADEAEIRALETARGRALMKGDIAALDRLLGDDLVHIHASGSVDDKAKFLEGVKTKYIFHEISRDDVALRIFGDAAIMTGLMVQSVSRRGEAERHAVTLRVTQVWLKTALGWKQNTWHSCFVNQP